MHHRATSRRSFLHALGAAPLILVTGSRAQRAGPPPRVGILANHVPRVDLELGAASPFHGIAAFVAGFAEAGWRDGANVRLVMRSAEGRMDRLPQLVSELVGMPVDVIVGGDDAMQAAARATKTIPIVAYGMYNPVENGYAVSLSRPGRNITGVANATSGAELQKALALLKQASPRIRRVALVAQSYERADLFPALRPGSALHTAGVALELDLSIMTFGDPRTLPELVRSAVRQGMHALMVDTNYAIHYHRENRERLAKAAIRQRMPVMHLSLTAAGDGALMAYGTDLTERWRRAAYFVNRILRGERPGDIPIEHPGNIQLHINRKAANAIGMEISPALLLQADRVFD